MKNVLKKDKNSLAKEQIAPKSGDNFNIYIQRVQKKAFELYQKNGCQDGYDQNNWFEAEKSVEAELNTAK